MDKLKSRKFWMAIIGAVLPVIVENYNLDIPTESLWVIIAYILGQSLVDSKKPQ